MHHEAKSFTWLLLLDHLNTRNMLRRRNYNVDSGFNCLLCSQAIEETVEHLFLCCPFSHACWSRLDISWALDGYKLHLVRSGKNQWFGPLFMEAFCIACRIWKERNHKLFKSSMPFLPFGVIDSSKIFALLIHRLT